MRHANCMKQDGIIYRSLENTLGLYRQDTLKENKKFTVRKIGRTKRQTKYGRDN